MFIVIYAFLYALALIQVGAYAESLPETMATHFGAGGVPNGYMRKEGFIVFYLGFMFFLPGLLMAVSVLIEKLPGSLINIPNKKYWMAASRQAETVKSLARGIRMLGLMTGLFLIAIDQLVINANLVKPPVLDERGTWLFLFAFVFAIISFLLWITIRFRKPDKET
ncbi:MAG: DUF1648 domain-containing protein [Alphaproteobacteria bacterium]